MICEQGGGAVAAHIQLGDLGVAAQRLVDVLIERGVLGDPEAFLQRDGRGHRGDSRIAREPLGVVDQGLQLRRREYGLAVGRAHDGVDLERGIVAAQRREYVGADPRFRGVRQEPALVAHPGGRLEERQRQRQHACARDDQGAQGPLDDPSTEAAPQWVVLPSRRRRGITDQRSSKGRAAPARRAAT